MFSKKQPAQNFATSLGADSLYGSIAATLFYLPFWLNIVNDAWLERYILGHPVSVATVYLFAIAIAVITRKLVTAFQQSRRVDPANATLLDLMQNMPPGETLASVRWLDYMLPAQPGRFLSTYFGNRFSLLLKRLIQRGSVDQFEKDLQELADEDAYAQHDSYSIVRIICWAMPMLGFLGTVIGISQTLGSMDMKLLASGDQAAMDSLTAGLYVAFDTTAIGLVLTIAAMFMQFVVSGQETRILNHINKLVSDRAYSCLKIESKDKANSDDLVHVLAKSITDSTSSAIEQLLLRQTSMWSAAMEKVDFRWKQVSETAGKQLVESLQQSIENALQSMAKEINKAEVAAIEALDLRYQQWQKTLSDQSRNLSSHHDELMKQTQLLHKLVENCEGFAALDTTVQQTLGRMTDVDRFHEAAVCMTEAIAVLGIQLERSGQIGKMVREYPKRSNNFNLFDENDSARDAA